MLDTRCISSRGMTKLFEWRNFRNFEDMRHNDRNYPVESKWKHVGKRIIAECGLVLLTLIAVVETVAYSVLTFLNHTHQERTNNEHEYSAYRFHKYLESSSFTILWGIANTLFFNLTSQDLLSHESLARFYAFQINPMCVRFFRLEDALQCYYFIESLRSDLLRDENQVLQGAYFIKNEVLKDASPETLQQFRDVDSEMVLFVLTKAIYIYATNNQKIPEFFKKETRNRISFLRKQLKEPELLKKLQAAMANPETFKAELKDEITNTALMELKNIAWGESQGSLFATQCWSQAIELLD